YLGIIPFVAAAAAVILQMPLGPFAGLELFVTYSAVILSFVAGSLWGKVMSSKDSGDDSKALVITTALSLVGWLALLLDHIPFALVILALGFFVAWIIERSPSIGESSYCPQDYTKMRGRLTLWVIVLHGILLLQLLV